MMYLLHLPLLLPPLQLFLKQKLQKQRPKILGLSCLVGLLLRPTTTATCRPRMWVQHISEGQINEPTRDDTHSTECGETETSVLAEGIPEELGHEWRVLHPFEIPGVRFPTDATPPNQRRLAENDALVELIQTTKYLEDTHMWGQRDYSALPPSVW